MFENLSRLNIVRVGENISFSSLKEIGTNLIEFCYGNIREFTLSHYKSPRFESIDAYFLTPILHEKYRGHTLGITDADLKTKDKDEFYNSIIRGKNPQNDVAVVSTKKLSPVKIDSEKDYELYLSRTLKVSLHEVGHNLGLIDHPFYQTARNGWLCPMSKGEFNKFGYEGYVKAIVDQRGFDFCDECSDFLRFRERKN